MTKGCCTKMFIEKRESCSCVSVSVCVSVCVWGESRAREHNLKYAMDLQYFFSYFLVTVFILLKSPCLFVCIHEESTEFV